MHDGATEHGSVRARIEKGCLRHERECELKLGEPPVRARVGVACRPCDDAMSAAAQQNASRAEGPIPRRSPATSVAPAKTSTGASYRHTRRCEGGTLDRAGESERGRRIERVRRSGTDAGEAMRGADVCPQQARRTVAAVGTIRSARERRPRLLTAREEVGEALRSNGMGWARGIAWVCYTAADASDATVAASASGKPRRNGAPTHPLGLTGNPC